MMTYGLASRLDDHDAARVSILSSLRVSASAAISGEPSSSSSASTSSLICAYVVTAWSVLYAWSLSVNSILRSHTPPLSFWVSQNNLRPISSPLPAPANGPVRSVSTPSLMVVSVTPGPVSSFAPPGDGELPPDLVCAHPVSAAAATSAAPQMRPRAARRRNNDMRFSFTSGYGQTGGAAAWRHRRRDRKSTRLNSSHVRISYAVFCL